MFFSIYMDGCVCVKCVVEWETTLGILNFGLKIVPEVEIRPFCACAAESWPKRWSGFQNFTSYRKAATDNLNVQSHFKPEEEMWPQRGPLAEHSRSVGHLPRRSQICGSFWIGSQTWPILRLRNQICMAQIYNCIHDLKAACGEHLCWKKWQCYVQRNGYVDNNSWTRKDKNSKYQCKNVLFRSHSIKFYCHFNFVACYGRLICLYTVNSQVNRTQKQ